MDITYIPMARCFVYLAAVVDWFSRRVLAWRLWITMEVDFCLDAVEEALAKYGRPKIFNTDRGSQFTSAAFTGLMLENKVAISMDGRGAWRDNVSLSNGSGGPSNTKRSTCGPMQMSARHVPHLADIWVADAIKDNKELRAKRADLEALPKSDEAFPERLKDLQKTFRQHARDEKRELLPAVQRALSEEQVQGGAEKIEAAVAEADQARKDASEERRVKDRQEREEVERQAERHAESERAQKAAAELGRHDEAAQPASARHEREEAERQAEQEAVGQQAQERRTMLAKQRRHDGLPVAAWQ